MLRKIVATLLFVLATGASWGASQSANQSIVDVHASLIAAGWQVFPLICEFREDKGSMWRYSDAPAIFRAGVHSIHHCSGTGRNLCSFYYRKDKVCKKVVTAGEYSDTTGAQPLLVVFESSDCPQQC